MNHVAVFISLSFSANSSGKSPWSSEREKVQLQIKLLDELLYFFSMCESVIRWTSVVFLRFGKRFSVFLFNVWIRYKLIIWTYVVFLRFGTCFSYVNLWSYYTFFYQVKILMCHAIRCYSYFNAFIIAHTTVPKCFICSCSYCLANNAESVSMFWWIDDWRIFVFFFTVHILSWCCLS